MFEKYRLWNWQGSALALSNAQPDDEWDEDDDWVERDDEDEDDEDDEEDDQDEEW
jgi:hypothetical protein